MTQSRVLLRRNANEGVVSLKSTRRGDAHDADLKLQTLTLHFRPQTNRRACP